MALAYVTAGESHGPAVIVIVSGMPADVTVDLAIINGELRRRQGGYGRGARQRIETDEVLVLSGVRGGLTMGGPVTLQIPNRDSRLDDPTRTPPVNRPRPGHADLAGAVKWLTSDCRNTLERASARETAGRTAAGALARCLLSQFGIEVFGYVRSMLDVDAPVHVSSDTVNALRAARDQSEVCAPDMAASSRIIEHIHAAKAAKDTVGGGCEVHVLNCPMGLGSCAQAGARLDARLAAAVMGIQAFKAVEIGLGTACGSRMGSAVHDPIVYDRAKAGMRHLGFTRPSNHAGGLEGGMTNGMPIVVRGTMKPISTLLQGMPSVNLLTGAAERSDYERSDVCALPAASVVMENVIAFEIARAFMEKFGGDTLGHVRASFEAWERLASGLVGS